MENRIETPSLSAFGWYDSTDLLSGFVKHKIETCRDILPATIGKPKRTLAKCETFIVVFIYMTWATPRRGGMPAYGRGASRVNHRASPFSELYVRRSGGRNRAREKRPLAPSQARGLNLNYIIICLGRAAGV